MRGLILALLWGWCAAVWATPVHINSASVEELDKALDGVGPKLAQRIVRYREAHGPFTAAEELMAVPYVGRRVLERIRPDVLID